MPNMITDTMVNLINNLSKKHNVLPETRRMANVYSRGRVTHLNELTMKEALELHKFLATCGKLPEGYWEASNKIVNDERIYYGRKTIGLLIGAGIIIDYETEEHFDKTFDAAEKWIKEKGLVGKSFFDMSIPEIKRVYRSAKMTADYKNYRQAHAATETLLKELCILTENQTN